MATISRSQSHFVPGEADCHNAGHPIIPYHRDSSSHFSVSPRFNGLSPVACATHLL
jgi:hypothetical protein